MKKDKKRELDVLTEIYMDNENQENFFKLNYPVDSETCTIDVVPDPTNRSGIEDPANTRIEQNL